jgi:NAD+ kinase
MKRLGVIGNTGKKDAPRVLSRLSEKAGELDIELFADENTAGLVECCRVCRIDEVMDNVDAVIALGGDGTVLRSVRLLKGRKVPIMGINIGGLGFLTSVAEDKLDAALECIAENRFSLSSRSIVDCSVYREGNDPVSYRALNDVVVSNGGSLRVVTLDVSVNGESVTSYICDGLVISTPTGSTGHSLSAGGPIVTPETCAFVIALICPHTLSSRPLLVPDSSVITVKVAGADDDIPLSVDGQVGHSLRRGDRIVARRSNEEAEFLHLPDYSYFGVLRQKLNWSGRNV